MRIFNCTEILITRTVFILFFGQTSNYNFLVSQKKRERKLELYATFYLFIYNFSDVFSAQLWNQMITAGNLLTLGVNLS